MTLLMVGRETAMTTNQIKILLFVLLGSPWLAAAEDSIYLHGLTEHYVSCSDPCNEVNPGISYKRRHGNRFVHVGGFENTHEEVAMFAVYGASRHWASIEWSAGLGMAAGYREKVGVTGLGLVPMFVLAAEVGPVYLAVIPGSVTLALRAPIGR